MPPAAVQRSDEDVQQLKQQPVAKTTLAKMSAKTDVFMRDKMKMSKCGRHMVFHYAGMLWEQLRAMLPITLLQVGTAWSHVSSTETCDVRQAMWLLLH